MANRFLNPKLSEELELDRPAKGRSERLFRILLIYAAASFTLYWSSLELLTLLPSVFRKSVFPNFGFKFGLGVWAVTVVISVFYALNYMVLRFVKNKFIKAAWWTMIILFAIFTILGCLLALLSYAVAT